MPVPEPVATPPEELVAGIDDGDQVSKNWQGFKTETPHAAPLSTVEQSAMTPQAGIPSESPEQPGTPAPPQQADQRPAQPAPLARPEQQDVPAPSESPTPAVPAIPAPPPAPELNAGEKHGVTKPADPPGEPAEPKLEAPKPTDAPSKPLPPDEGDTPAQTPRVGEVTSQTQVPPVPERDKAEAAEGDASRSKPQKETTADQVVEPEPVVEPVAEPTPPSPQTAESRPASPAEPQPPSPQSPADQPAGETRAAPAPAQPNGGGAGFGEQAPEESDAAALRESIAVEPGKTLAREGVQIRTVRPRWSTTTRVTAVPRNPLIDVTFDSTGRVAKAAFAPGKNTGYAAVDGPLLDSIYRWRASGSKFAEAVAEKGKLSLRFKMLLRDEAESSPLPMQREQGPAQ
ncbi:MAG: hypothetical protein ACOYN0_07890 [Phycisphaerales bacterium]